MTFFKFPSTPYVVATSVVGNTDKIMTDNCVKNLLSEPVTIEEKIDGANLGISFSSDGEIQLQNRGNYLLLPFKGQWSPLSGWVKEHADDLFDNLLDRYIVYGEWCYAKHSIYYNRLPDWFIAFDVFDKTEKRFLSVRNRNAMLQNLHLAIVPKIDEGMFTIENLLSIQQKSQYGDGQCEGIYIRQDRGNWLYLRAKLVRADFSQLISTHWSKRKITPNSIEKHINKAPACPGGQS